MSKAKIAAAIVAVTAAGVMALNLLPVARAGSPDTKNVPAAYVGLVAQAAGTCDLVNGPLLAAQIQQESNWDPNAVSPAGAQGIAQFKPDTWAAYGGDANGDGSSDPFDPADAIIAQGRYMCALAGMVGGVPGDRVRVTLWAYNAGPQATIDANDNPPTAEADNYANRIFSLIPKYTP
jgi:soluble lytic murein transglycosylase-like protein